MQRTRNPAWVWAGSQEKEIELGKAVRDPLTPPILQTGSGGHAQHQVAPHGGEPRPLSRRLAQDRGQSNNSPQLSHRLSREGCGETKAQRGTVGWNQAPGKTISQDKED